MIGAAGALALGCSSKSGPPDAGALADSAPAASAGAIVVAAHLPTAHAAARCGDCHEPMYDEWQTSAHARAVADPLYMAMRARMGGGSPASTTSCDGCHAPLAGRVEPGSAIDEGVTCEACHSIKDVEDQGASAKTIFQIGTVKNGPLCDAKRHYFHEMGCSPLHRESRVCAGCHLWSMPAASGPAIPVFTEYAEWRDSAAKKGISCQDCHMPTTTREVARGSPARAGVPYHGFMGYGGLHGQALAVTAKVSDDHGRVAVTVAMRNQGAGHAVPTGLPGKQLLLRVAVVDAAGRELAREERAYARLLTDDHGAEVPFFAATRIGADTRIAADATREEAFSFDVAPAGEVRIAVVERALSPALAASLGVPVPADTPLVRAAAPFGARGAGARPLLPKTVTARP